ncbi:hypothetical protein ACED96_13345 [Clostridium thermobutyricum]
MCELTTDDIIDVLAEVMWIYRALSYVEYIEENSESKNLIEDEDIDLD